MLNIRFFTQADNQSVSPTANTKKVKKPVPLTGYVSNTGKLVLPTKTVQATSDLGGVQAMKVGSQAGKRKLTVLYLIPTDEQDTEGFPVVVTPRGVTIELAHILTGGRVNYKAEKYSFTLKAFTDQEGAIGYELQLTTLRTEEKAPYTGKPRGRKPKAK
jgi:hypothetical protein